MTSVNASPRAAVRAVHVAPPSSLDRIVLFSPTAIQRLPLPATPKSCLSPWLRDVHVDPSALVRIVPNTPVATYFEPSKSMAYTASRYPPLRAVHDPPSGLLTMVPRAPTATRVDPLDASAWRSLAVAAAGACVHRRPSGLEKIIPLSPTPTSPALVTCSA